MGFFPTAQARRIPPEGNPRAKIAFIGEAGGATEDKLLRPFVGRAGTVLDQCLQASKILRHSVYITNVFKFRPPGNDIAPYFDERRMIFTDLARPYLDELDREIKSLGANVLVPLGNPAMCAIVGERPPWRIERIRGYVVEGRFGHKVIPTIHPAATLYEQGARKPGGERISPYIKRYYIVNDLKKALHESTFPEIKRPQRDLLIPSDIKNALEWLDYFNTCPRLSVDIEVINFEVSSVSLADSPTQAMAFPLYHNVWDEAEEVAIWKALAVVLGNKKIIKIFQNGIFDIHFLAVRAGIIVEPIDPEHIEDTMMAHSVMYMEMLKGLGFLGSMHCGAQEYWKDMVKFDNIKENA